MLKSSLTLLACATSILAFPAAPEPGAGGSVFDKRQTSIRAILARQAREPGKRGDTPSGTPPTNVCPWNTGSYSGVQNAYFDNTQFAYDGSAVLDQQSTGSTSNACTSFLDNHSGNPAIAYYESQTCILYSSFDTSSQFVYQQGHNTILPNTDCTTAIAKYGNPSGTCCHMYATLT